MVDIIATLFRFQQFVFEFGPFFLVSWLGLAVTTALITSLQGRREGLKAPGGLFLKYRFARLIWRPLFLLLWRPAGKTPVPAASNGLLLFSVIASVPALVATSLLGMEVVLLRVILTVPYILFLNWFLTSILLPGRGKPGEQRSETVPAIQSPPLAEDNPLSPPASISSTIKVAWKSFIAQLDGAVVPLVIGLILASALTIHVPAYAVIPWLGEGAWQGPYLASLLTVPLQLLGGAEVFLASALLVKGASLGTVLSVMLVAPGTAFTVIRHLSQPVRGKTIAPYLAAAWLLAGSLGLAVDGIQRFLGSY